MDSAPAVVSVETIRCMRCASATEMTSTDDPSSYGMVRISTNLYYCERPAAIDELIAHHTKKSNFDISMKHDL
ncbi:hypothetical protein ACHAQH_002585 [Verticillium albo-atrum]